MSEFIALDKLEEERKEAFAKAYALAVDGAGLFDVIKTLEAISDIQSKTLSMAIHDINLLAQKIMQVEATHITTASTASVIATALIEKDVITQDEFQGIWERDVTPQLEKAGLTSKKEGPAKRVKPAKSGIIIP